VIGIRAAMLFSIVVLAAPSLPRAADDPTLFDDVARDYEGSVRPLLKQFCLKCHSTEQQDGELDLERFGQLADIRRAPRVWQKVIEMLDNGEMPPRKKLQPTDPQRKQIRNWARRYLDAEGRANAGDPGSVLLRRLSNVEYNNTVRDLTRVDLQPAREFPVDGAAGEGFTNVGEALAMSPAMFDKYLAAAKGIAAHAVLLPDGFRFSDKATRRDWTDEIVNQIRLFYRQHTVPEGSTRVNLQGLVWDTNSGGRIPLEAYLSATIRLREWKGEGPRPIAAVAAEYHLSPKYLQILWDILDTREPSLVIDRIRGRWRSAKLDDVAGIAAEIRQWQSALTKFNSVAHFKPWIEAVNPVTESQSFRVKLEGSPNRGEVVLNLTVRDAGDGPSGDCVEWRQPRLESPGRPPILLRDLRDGLRGIAAKRRELNEAAAYLAAAETARGESKTIDVQAIATERQLDASLLAAWFDYLGIVAQGDLKLESVFTQKMDNGGGYAFVKGWGVPETPSVTANSSDQEVHIPGTLKPHSVAVHPSPSQNVAVGWRSPISGRVRIDARVIHAHPACGNGVSWSLEVRRGGGRRRLAGGEIDVGKPAKTEPIDNVALQTGDLVSLLVGPRGTNHSCDLTEVDLTIKESEGDHRTWTLSREVSGDILAGNPHADDLGHRDVWYFYPEKITSENGSFVAVVPKGSLLDRWQEELQRSERDRLAGQLQELITNGPPPENNHPDTALYNQLTSMSGPLLGKLDFARLAADARTSNTPTTQPIEPTKFGLPRELFGNHPAGQVVDDANLIVEAPSTLEIRLPADLATGREFVVSAALDAHAGTEGSVQAQAMMGPPPAQANLVPGVPILVRNASATKTRIEKSLEEFRRVFPAALCYVQIVPVDEVVTLVLFHREDDGLSRLMLDDAQRQTIDRLWDELRYVSQDALKVREAYGQFMEYVTQDGDVRLFEPLRKPIAERAEALHKRLQDTQPAHLEALFAFAARAYRRPLGDPEQTGLRDLYTNLRTQNLDHDAAFRLTLTRILMAPSFLYRTEQSASGAEAKPISEWELASRLSYFLWSSMPDDELRHLAADAKLHDPEVLAAQARRMIKDDRARALSTEFACQWLDIRDFDSHNEKSEKVFPEFAALRGPMYEESIRFFVDLFQRNGSILDVLDADHAFLNESLAKHYGIPNVSGPEWRRVDGVKAYGRGGILGMATLLSKQSGASRTSPILRGNWLLEMLLGEKLPKPPKNVPLLPESELDTNGLTLRQITEKHRAIESCAKCHDRIDPFGFALEGFDAIGRRRTADLARRPIDTQVQLIDGTKFADIDGLRNYLLTEQRDPFLKYFCRKLLGYSLGRSVQLSDEPLLADMREQLAQNDYRVQAAILAIIRSPQFRLRRGLDSPLDQEPINP
jgi:hypothetical protein